MKKCILIVMFSAVCSIDLSLIASFFEEECSARNIEQRPNARKEFQDCKKSEIDGFEVIGRSEGRSRFDIQDEESDCWADLRQELFNAQRIERFLLFGKCPKKELLYKLSFSLAHFNGANDPEMIHVDWRRLNDR